MQATYDEQCIEIGVMCTSKSAHSSSVFSSARVQELIQSAGQTSIASAITSGRSPPCWTTFAVPWPASSSILNVLRATHAHQRQPMQDSWSTKSIFLACGSSSGGTARIAIVCSQTGCGLHSIKRAGLSRAHDFLARARRPRRVPAARSNRPHRLVCLACTDGSCSIRCPHRQR